MFRFTAPSSQRSPASRVPFALGKVPRRAEFLAPRTSREPESSLDAWLEAGMQLASYRHGPTWATSSFEGGAVTGFVWRAPRQAKADVVLTGLLFPSRDAVDRHYPFVPCAPVPARAIENAPHIAPLAFGGFLERVYTATFEYGFLEPAAIIERLAMIAPPAPEEISQASAEYDAWCCSTRLDTGWSGVFGERAIEPLMATIHALGAACDVVRGVEQPTSPTHVRLPLGSGGPGSAALWLDVVRRLCQWRATIPSSFWAVEGGTLVVALGDAAPEAVGDLWPGDRGVPLAHDLTTPRPDSAAPMPSPGLTMREFLDSLSR